MRVSSNLSSNTFSLTTSIALFWSDLFLRMTFIFSFNTFYTLTFQNIKICGLLGFHLQHSHSIRHNSSIINNIIFSIIYNLYTCILRCPYYFNGSQFLKFLNKISLTIVLLFHTRTHGNIAFNVWQSLFVYS